MYHNIDAERMRTPMTPQERMSKAAKEYIRAAQEIDPTVNTGGKVALLATNVPPDWRPALA